MNPGQRQKKKNQGQDNDDNTNHQNHSQNLCRCEHAQNPVEQTDNDHEDQPTDKRSNHDNGLWLNRLFFG